MTTVTVAVEVRIVLIELHGRPAEHLVAALRRPLGDPLSGPVMGQKIFQRPTFRRGIFRVRMVVVEAGSVREDQITLHLMKRKRPMGIDLGKFVFFFVLLQA